MAESKKESYMGDPEALHSMSKDLDKKSQDGFLNPGTPAAPLVGMADRKTGQVNGGASDALRSRLQPTANDVTPTGTMSSNNGVLPIGQ